MNNIQNTLGTLNTLLGDLDKFTVAALDHISDASGDLDEDSYAFEALDEASELCEDIQKLIEHAMIKAEKAIRVINNA